MRLLGYICHFAPDRSIKPQKWKILLVYSGGIGPQVMLISHWLYQMKKYPPKLPRFNNIETEQEREKPAQLRGKKKRRKRERVEGFYQQFCHVWEVWLWPDGWVLGRNLASLNSQFFPFLSSSTYLKTKKIRESEGKRAIWPILCCGVVSFADYYINIQFLVFWVHLIAFHRSHITIWFNGYKLQNGTFSLLFKSCFF